MTGLLFCILFNMVTTGFCLLCIHCSKKGNASCTGALKNCSEDQSCASTVKQTTYIGGHKIQSIDRGCGAIDRCNTSRSISSMLRINTHIVCCSTNNCTPVLPEFSNVAKPLNDVRCPVCLTHERDCSVLKLMNCTGDELYCASYEITNSGGKRKTEMTAPPSAKTYIKGCASESFCQSNADQESGNGLQVLANCLRGASHCLVYPSLVLLFVVLLGNSIC